MTSQTPGIPPIPPPPGNSSSPYGAPPSQQSQAQAGLQQAQARPPQPGHPQQYGQPSQAQPTQYGAPTSAPAAPQSSHMPQSHMPQYGAPTQPGYAGGMPQQPQATASKQTVQQVAATYEAAPISWAKALKPSQLGLFAAIAVGVSVLLDLLMRVLPAILFSSFDVAGYSAISLILNLLSLVVYAAAAVLGGLGFHRSGRRDVVAFAAGAIGALSVVVWVLSFVIGFFASVVGF